MKRNGIYKVTIIDNQGELPAVVKTEMKKLWRQQELGNNFDHYPWDEEMNEEYPAIALFIADNNIQGSVYLHCWW